VRAVTGGLTASMVVMLRQYKVNGEKIMPVRRVTVNGETFYQWGTSGKMYKNRADAERQGYAIEQQGYRKSNKAKK